MTTRAIRALCAWLLLTAVTVASAETAYVDDRLQIGLHADKTLASPIVEMLPAGTAMEVLARDSGMAQVRLPDGREGWVDSTFLAATAPGRARVVALEAELDRYRAQLAELQAQIAELEARESADPGARPSDAARAEPIPSETLREIQTLAEENRRLKEQIAELKTAQRAFEERAPPSATGADKASAAANETSMLGIAHWERWQQILLASALLLAFAAGGWLVDWGVRRRHGGFRV